MTSNDLYESTVGVFLEKGHNDHEWAHYDGVFYCLDGLSPEGGYYLVFREEHHTTKQIREAKKRIRRDHDPVQLNVCAVQSDPRLKCNNCNTSA